MTGGILQLASRGQDDIFLTADPQITFFKTVYRRHTNFSRTEYNLKFCNKLSFGKKGLLKVERLGDLLHRLFLVIRLPRIDLVYKKFTICEVNRLLLDHDITCINDNDEQEWFTEEHYKHVKVLIKDKIKHVNYLIDTYNKIINELKTCDLPCGPDDYTEYVISKIMAYDQTYNKSYDYITNYIRKIKQKPTELINATQIKNLINDKLSNIMTNDSNNLAFIHEINNNFDVTNENQMNTLITKINNNSYLHVYDKTDAFIECKYLLHNNNILTNEKLEELIKYNISNNFVLLQDIYDSLMNNSFVFYKNGINNWVNLSSIPIPGNINGIDYLLHKISKETKPGYLVKNIINFIKDFHQKLDDIMYTYANEIENHIDHRLDISLNYNDLCKYYNRPEEDFMMFKGIHWLNLQPLYMITDIINKINDSLSDYLCSCNHEKADTNIEESVQNMIVLLHSYAKKLKRKIIPYICKSEDWDIFMKMSNIKSQEFIILCTLGNNILIPTRSGILYTVTEYIIKKIKKKCEKLAKECYTWEIIKDVRNEIITNAYIKITESYINTYNDLYNNKLLNPCNYGEDMSKCICHINECIFKNIKCEYNMYIKPEEQLSAIYNQIQNYLYKEKHAFIEKNKCYCKYKKLLCDSLDLSFINSHIVFNHKYKDIINNAISDEKLKEMLKTKHKTVFDIIKKLDKCNDECIFQNICKDKLLCDLEFKTDYDLCVYIREIIIKESLLEDAYEQIKILDNNNLINYLQCHTPCPIKYTCLIEILKNSLKCNENKRAKFAWIRNIGHYIINNIEVMLDDQVIDVQTGEWLHIWHSLTKRLQKERGYNALIGNIPELYDYNNNIKEEYELIIPLKFWFCKTIGSSLPLIALQNTEVKIFIELKDFDKVAYYESNTYTRFINKPKLDCEMIGEYIFVDNEERFKISNMKHEYLIETVQNFGDMEITNDVLTDINTFTAEYHFKFLVKELIWVAQRLDFINGSLPNGELLYDNYSLCTNELADHSIIEYSEIDLDGRIREHAKEYVFYNYVQPYVHHSASPSPGINCYSFALNPEKLQPSGVINMGRLNDTEIRIILTKEMIELINKGIRLRFNTYGLTTNILRVMSGLSGLAFYY